MSGISPALLPMLWRIDGPGASESGLQAQRLTTGLSDRASTEALAQGSRKMFNMGRVEHLLQLTSNGVHLDSVGSELCPERNGVAQPIGIALEVRNGPVEPPRLIPPTRTVVQLSDIHVSQPGGE